MFHALNKAVHWPGFLPCVVLLLTAQVWVQLYHFLNLSGFLFLHLQNKDSNSPTFIMWRPSNNAWPTVRLNQLWLSLLFIIVNFVWFFFLYIYSAAPGLNCGMWDLSSLTRDWTLAPCRVLAAGPPEKSQCVLGILMPILQTKKGRTGCMICQGHTALLFPLLQTAALLCNQDYYLF